MYIDGEKINQRSPAQKEAEITYKLFFKILQIGSYVVVAGLLD